jgi:hypothetical protein
LPFAFCHLNFELLFWDEQIKWQRAKVKRQMWRKCQGQQVAPKATHNQFSDPISHAYLVQAMRPLTQSQLADLLSCLESKGDGACFGAKVAQQ